MIGYRPAGATYIGSQQILMHNAPVCLASVRSPGIRQHIDPFLGQGSAAARLRLPLTLITGTEQKALIDAL